MNHPTGFHIKQCIEGSLTCALARGDGEGQAKPCVLIDGTASVLAAHPTDGANPVERAISNPKETLLIISDVQMLCTLLV